MSEPFLAEVKMVGFTFAPRGWALCDGQLLPINQHQSLYSLLGTMYGGDGRRTFRLPDLRGRTPMAPGNNGSLTLQIGQRGGAEVHTLRPGELPAHTHNVMATKTAGDKKEPGGNLLAAVESPLYSAPENLTPLASTVIGDVGLSQSHDNMQPVLAVNFCIAMRGLFPSRN